MKNHTITGQTSNVYQLLSQRYSLIKNKFLPELDRKLKEKPPSEAERTLRDTFIRIYSATGSLSKLGNRHDFLAAFSLTRIIFEIYIDMNLLDKEIISDGFKKYCNHLRYGKYVKYKRRKDRAEQNQFPFEDKFPKREHFLQNANQKDIKKSIKQLWGTENLHYHWSGLDLLKRCAKLGSDFIEKLLEVYDYANDFIHPGQLDWNLIKDGEGAGRIVAYAHTYSMDLFMDCCKICSDHFNISLASLDKYRHEIKENIKRQER